MTTNRFSRRTFLAGSALAAAAVTAPAALFPTRARAQNAELLGTVTVTDFDGARLHSYMAPVDSFYVNTQIIESANSVVVVDGQFILPFAQEVRGYIDSLGKPIDRVLLSHAHPDHWIGLAAFADAPIYALAGVQEALAATGQQQVDAQRQNLGELVPETAVIPTEIVEPGEETIDGIRYEFERVVDGEAPEQLVIRLPELGTLIVQDLAFNYVHLFLGNNTTGSWSATVQSLNALEDYNTVLLGHGEQTDVRVFEENLAYLRDATAILGEVDNVDDLRARLLAFYPRRRGAGLIDIAASFLYPSA